MKNAEVIVVGALATKVSNIAPMRASAEAIAEGQAIHYVHGGVEAATGSLSVATPAQQEAQMSAIIERKPDTKFLLLSQSMGALAALHCIETHPTQAVAISVAPPLRYPSDVIRHPRIGAMSKIIDGELILPSRSFALGNSGPTKYQADPSTLPDPVKLHAPRELFEEIDDANGEYWTRTVEAINANRLSVIMPTNDWNITALKAAEDLPKVTYLEGPHSLITEPVQLQRNVAAISALAFSLLHSIDGSID